MRAAAVAVCALALAGTAAAAPAPTAPVYDGAGRLVQTPFVPTAESAQLDEEEATELALEHPRVAGWLERYPPRPATEAEYDASAAEWTVRVWSGRAGQIAEATVLDASREVTDVRTGPQVAWQMARGNDGGFGGRTLNEPLVWLAFCAVFLLGLADLRRPLSLRNLDLLVLLSFSASLWFFNEGRIFAAAPLAYPPMLYLLGRAAYVGWTGRVAPGRPLWPAWVLASAAVFLAGFRVGLNVTEPRNVIDVGYAGVIGAHRIANGQAPYGHMPVQDDLKPCGAADAEGEIRDRIQTNGRCEHQNPHGDTYGPVSYLAYVPAYLAVGWEGDWDELWAAHVTSIAFDLLALAALALIGLRLGGRPLAATLAFAWAAYPFTQFASGSNTNDSIMPAILLVGFWLAAWPFARGAFLALAGWTKFAALLLVPLWFAHPRGFRSRGRGRFLLGFAAATVAAFSVLLLEPDAVEAARTFYDHTVGFQLDRGSPFSIWDWGQYHAAGIPDLGVVQHVVQALVVLGALALAFVPRRRSPVQLAALTAAVLIGFELALTHWSHLYIPWFYPFVAVAALAARPAPSPVEEHVDEPRALAPAG